MAEGSLGGAAGAMAGELIGADPEARWQGADLDSRRIQPGQLFFALPGERTDGHRFVADAWERGAAAAVVERLTAELEGPLISVEDSFAALHDLTRAVRRRTPRKMVAVTGSAGKTTTKELLVAMLSSRYRVAATPGNLNNLYGFPIALLGIPEETEWMVAEMGMSTPGELGGVARLGRPDVAVLTNVRPVHLEFFGTIEAIAAAKAEILQGLSEDGLVVANADDPQLVRVLRSHPRRILWFGQTDAAEVRWSDVEPLPRGGSRFRLRVDRREIQVELALFGSFNVANFVAAAACAHELGVGLEEIAAVGATARAPAMRGIVHHRQGDVVIVDDSYNSNPEALELVLASTAAIPGERHWAVLGEMLELGEEAAEYHHRAGEQAAGLGFSPVVGVGEASRELVGAAAAAGIEAEWESDAGGAAERAAGILSDGDVVLVKGSRGVGLDVVVERLLELREESG